MQRGRGNIGARLWQFLRPFSGGTFWGFVLRRRWLPAMEDGRRERELGQWRKAVERSLGWA